MRADGGRKGRRRDAAAHVRPREAEQRVEPHGDALRRPAADLDVVRDALASAVPKPSSRSCQRAPATARRHRARCTPERRRRGARRPTTRCRPARRRWSCRRGVTSEGRSCAVSRASTRTRSARRSASPTCGRRRGRAGAAARRRRRPSTTRRARAWRAFLGTGPARRRGTWTRDSPTGSRSRRSAPPGGNGGRASRRRPSTADRTSASRGRRRSRATAGGRRAMRSPWHESLSAIGSGRRAPGLRWRTPVVFAGCVNQSRSADALVAAAAESARAPPAAA